MWCRVYEAVGPTDAYLVRDWLERNGIATWLRGESLVGLRGELPMHLWPAVFVMDTDRDRAEIALQTFHGPALVHPEWKCLRCGEVNGPSFGSCWSCGSDVVVEATDEV